MLQIVTIKEFADLLAKKIVENPLGLWKYEYTTIDSDYKTDYSHEEIQKIYDDAYGWFGINSVDTGYNSDTFVVTDYYGGGSGVSNFFNTDFDEENDIKEKLQSMIIEAIDYNGQPANENTVLIIEDVRIS